MERRRVDLVLVERGLFESRAKARAAILAGAVAADGELVSRASQLIAVDAAISAEPAHPWVSRAGLKLDHALSIWPIEAGGRAALDVGASTGGFTQVLLARGAARVHAVDVGHGQLHASLGADPRVIALEGVDARALTPAHFPEPPSLIVCDASFIGLAKVLAVPLSLAAVEAELIALVKPQFEVGSALVGNGGAVRSADARAAAVRAVAAWLEDQSWTVEGEADSPILGGEGAREYLIWARRSAP